MKTNFHNDFNEIKILENFLDTKVYPHVFTKTQRRTDKKAQLLGVDIICDNITVDEKAQIAYKNNPLPTQVLEISFISRTANNRRMRGWFIDNKLKTQVYAFIFLTKVSGVTHRWEPLRNENQLEEIEIIFVKKTELRKLVEQKAPLIHFIKKADSMRKGLLPPTLTYRGLKMVFSEKIPEKPVNIVFKKKDLPKHIHVTWHKENGVKIH